MAGVWPWMERRRLACGDHLGKLVVEVGDKDTRRGQWALCGLRSLLRAGQLDHLDRLGTWVGGTRPRWKQGGQSVWQEGGQVSTHLSTETLALVPGRGEGSQGPAASSGGERCLTRLTMDSTRLGEVDTNSLCITAAKAKPGPAGQEGWGQGPGKRHPV